MTDTTTHSTLISLFHTEEQAQETLRELEDSGISQSAVQTIGARGGPESGSLTSAIQRFNLPDSDLTLLSEGLQNGGTVIIVTASGSEAETVEEIFRTHRSHQVDERTLEDASTAAVPAMAQARSPVNPEGQTTIPVVEEELVVGKRAVQAGGVRVISRMRETPVTESVNLREEHFVLDRQSADRPATEADFQNAGRFVEVTETAEEVVVGKKARIVEEIVLSKETTERTENVSDTVRHTEVDVERIAADDVAAPTEQTKRTRRAGSGKESI